jgi:hypothetical protein
MVSQMFTVNLAHKRKKIQINVKEIQLNSEFNAADHDVMW